MHKNALMLCQRFVWNHIDPWDELTVLDVGSRQVRRSHPTIKQLLHYPAITYLGLDLEPGRNVDVVAAQPYDYPIDSNSIDVVFSANCMEHATNPIAYAKEISRVLKPTGKACIVAPIVGRRHCKVDCWRIFPDGMRSAFCGEAGLQEIEIGTDKRDTFAYLRKR